MQPSGKLRNVILIWLAVLALTLTAIQPFLQNAMIMSADGTLHLYRLVTLDHSMADGSLWSRYVAGMVYGYGSPLFNYYSPASLYVMQGVYIAGVSFVQAWLIGMCIYAFIAGLGAFYLGKAWAGTVGGIIMVVAYGYAPYTLFDSIWRGTVSEFASLALLPWVLWGIWRVANAGKRRDVIMTAFIFGLYFIMHNVITLHSSVLIGGYTLVVWLFSRDKTRSLLRLGVALGVGFFMVAFFWLPALSETGYVKIDAITANLPEIDVIGNLTDLGDVLRLPITADPTQLEPSVPVTLNWLQLIFAGLALVLVFVRKTASVTRVMVIIFALLTVLFVFMNTTASSYLWEVIPLIRYSQFPWRLIGLASLTIALMASIGIANITATLKSAGVRLAFVGAALFAFMLYGMPWIYSLYLPDMNPQTIVDAQDFERETGFIGTSSFAEYVPIWSSELPDENRLIPRYEAQEIIPRLEPPATVNITAQEWSNTSGHFTYTATDDTEVIFDWFFFPGWVATVDGEPVNFYPTEPQGLIALTLPAGTHDVSVALTRTDRQNLSVIISIGALVVLVGTMLINPLWSLQETQSNAQYLDDTDARRYLLMAIIIGVSAFGIKSLIIDRIDSPIKSERFAQGIEAGVEIPLQANFDNQMILLGADIDEPTVASGDVMTVFTYWQAQQEIDTDYSVILTLYDAEGNIVSQIADWKPGGVTTGNWLIGYYVRQSIDFEIPAGTPPGIYQLRVEMYQPETGVNLNVLNEAGNPIGVDVLLGDIDVLRPAQALNIADRENLTDALLGDLRLLDAGALPPERGVGDVFVLDTLWTIDTNVTTTPELSLNWVNDGETVASSGTFPPVMGYPVDQWQPYDVWRGLKRVYVPGNLEDGRYEVMLIESGTSNRVPLGEMVVNAPDRVYSLPDDVEALDISWQNGIVLDGFALDEEQLTLYWRTDNLISDDLRVFVHLVDENERIVHQFDGRPANWTRPTTGWDIGEIVRETYSLPDYAGLTLRIGWYDPLTGDRISLEDGAGFYDMGL